MKSGVRVAAIALSLVACKTNLAPIEDRITKVEAKFDASLKAKDEEIAKLKEELSDQDASIERLQFSVVASDSTVSTSLVAQHVTLGAGKMFLDIRPQPSFASHALGRGRFDVSDRELKAAILELVDSAKENYQTFFKESKSATPWDKLSVEVAHNGYNIGVYSGGVLKLKGE